MSNDNKDPKEDERYMSPMDKIRKKLAAKAKFAKKEIEEKPVVTKDKK